MGDKTEETATSRLNSRLCQIFNTQPAAHDAEKNTARADNHESDAVLLPPVSVGAFVGLTVGCEVVVGLSLGSKVGCKVGRKVVVGVGVYTHSPGMGELDGAQFPVGQVAPLASMRAQQI